jgi:hypothetical protein
VKAGATDLSGISNGINALGDGSLTRRDLRADAEFILMNVWYVNCSGKKEDEV